MKLYIQKNTTFRLPNKTLTKWTETLYGVKQDCGIPMDFFNFIHEITLKFLDKIMEVLPVWESAETVKLLQQPKA